MKHTLVLLLSFVVIANAIDNSLIKKQTLLLTDPSQPYNPGNNQSLLAQKISPVDNTDNFPILGRIEYIGGTCYDWVNGPSATWCINDPANGIHTTWLWSNTEAMSDRNMRYNFYDWSTHTWNWINTSNYMQSGINVFSHVMTSVAGGADLDRTSGNFVICGNYASSGSILPELGRDIAPGNGLFEYTQGPLGYRWPFIAVSQNQSIHIACIDATSTDSLFYTRCSPWGTWSTPIRIPFPTPDPMFPNQNIAASKVSNKVCIVWEFSEDAGQERAFYRISNDNGANWQTPTQLPFPPSTGMAPSFGVSSLFAMYDAQDNLHIVASVSDTGVTVPAEIWHWCPQNNPQWSLIHHFEPETLTAPVGYNAIFACRPTLIQEPTTNYFYVCWEQFDSLNYEPMTSRARADIHIAQSNNNGQTWNAKARITDPNTTSKRFPVVGGVQVTPSTTDKDTLFVLYMVDSIAGAFLQGEHRYCVNPMVLQRIPVPLATSIEEQTTRANTSHLTLEVNPNPLTTSTNIYYTRPAHAKTIIEVYDISGKLIKTFSDNQHNRKTWNRTDNNGNKVNAGVYYILLKTENKTLSKKIIIN